MALPTDFTALEEFFDDTLFSGAFFSGTKGFAPQGKKVLEARDKVEKAVAVKNKKRDAFVLANVAQFIAWEAVREPLVSLERQIDAHFDADRAGYEAVFGSTVAVMLRASESRRVETLAPVVAFASRPGHKGKLAAAAKAFLAARADHAAAAAAVLAAEKALTAAIKAVGNVKHGGVVVMREVDAHARGVFADDPAQAKKFFRVKGGGKADLESELAKAEARAVKAAEEVGELRAKVQKALELKQKAEAKKKGKDGEPVVEKIRG